ncbi:DUF3135 domain-containing protein [Marinospirillum perlucidum]|uniref:DUF3135 domain-containing protein n=1 Tax=Marinospirillum perlucidum TaxID=1982602 RepID=UPI000DF40776|nr:DUF3135 domain-containing protein [Marinospirillum perlucidum]
MAIRKWPVLASFDELLAMHQEGRLDDYCQKMNQQTLDLIPEDRQDHPRYLLFKMQAIRARASGKGLGAALDISALMHEHFQELNQLLHAFPDAGHSDRSVEATKTSKQPGRLLPFSGSGQSRV